MDDLPEIPVFVNRFAPRLNFEIRCAIFALHHHKEIPASVLAEAFGIHRRTAIMIVRTTSKFYKDVHREANRLGETVMYQTYVKPEHIHKLQMVANHRNQPRVQLPNKAANKDEGTYLKYDIRWAEEMYNGEPWVGWAYWEPPDPRPLGNDQGEPFRTSTECRRYLEKYWSWDLPKGNQ